MSLLFPRNDKGKWKRPFTSSNSSRRTEITPKSTEYSATPSRNVSNAIQSGQILLQRFHENVVTPSSTTQSTVKNYHNSKSVSMDRHHELQNEEISMEEVMKDLRLLEEQQRAAQRKVASIRVTKQQKIEEEVVAEQQLSNVKYENAQDRERLERSRAVLKLQTREFLSIKLWTSSSSKDLKSYHEKLKKSMETAQALIRCRRLIQHELLLLKSSLSNLETRKNDIAKKLEASLFLVDEGIHSVSTITKKIQCNTHSAHALSVEIVKCRDEVNEFESDLISAENTQARAEISLTERIQEIQNKTASLSEDLVYKIEAKKATSIRFANLKQDLIVLKNSVKEAHTLKEKLLRKRQLDGKQSGLAIGSQQLKLELVDMRKDVEEAERQRNRKRLTLEKCVQENIQIKNSINELNEQADINNKENLIVRQKLGDLQTLEVSIKQQYEIREIEEKNERIRILELDENLKKFSEKLENFLKDEEVFYSIHEKRVLHGVDLKNEAESRLAQELRSLDVQREVVGTTETECRSRRIIAREDLELAEKMFNTARGDTLMRMNEIFDIDELLDEIQKDKMKTKQNLMDTQTALIQNNPSLRLLDLQIDNDDSLEDNFQNKLQTWKRICDERLNAAVYDRQERLDEEKKLRKAIKIKEAEINRQRKLKQVEMERVLAIQDTRLKIDENLRSDQKTLKSFIDKGRKHQREQINKEKNLQSKRINKERKVQNFKLRSQRQKMACHTDIFTPDDVKNTASGDQNRALAMKRRANEKLQLLSSHETDAKALETERSLPHRAKERRRLNDTVLMSEHVKLDEKSFNGTPSEAATSWQPKNCGHIERPRAKKRKKVNLMNDMPTNASRVLSSDESVFLRSQYKETTDNEIRSFGVRKTQENHNNSFVKCDTMDISFEAKGTRKKIKSVTDHRMLSVGAKNNHNTPKSTRFAQVEQNMRVESCVYQTPSDIPIGKVNISKEVVSHLASDQLPETSKKNSSTSTVKKTIRTAKETSELPEKNSNLFEDNLFTFQSNSQKQNATKPNKNNAKVKSKRNTDKSEHDSTPVYWSKAIKAKHGGSASTTNVSRTKPRSHRRKKDDTMQKSTKVNINGGFDFGFSFA